jgi:hypothetical protein
MLMCQGNFLLISTRLSRISKMMVGWLPSGSWAVGHARLYVTVAPISSTCFQLYPISLGKIERSVLYQLGKVKYSIRHEFKINCLPVSGTIPI